MDEVPGLEEGGKGNPPERNQRNPRGGQRIKGRNGILVEPMKKRHEEWLKKRARATIEAQENHPIPDAIRGRALGWAHWGGMWARAERKDYTRTIGNIIRKAMLEQRVSQEELGNRIGASQRGVRHMLDGTNAMPVDRLYRMCWTLNLDIGEVVSWPKRKPSGCFEETTPCRGSDGGTENAGEQDPKQSSTPHQRKPPSQGETRSEHPTESRS